MEKPIVTINLSPEDYLTLNDILLEYQKTVSVLADIPQFKDTPTHNKYSKILEQILNIRSTIDSQESVHDALKLHKILKEMKCELCKHNQDPDSFLESGGTPRHYKKCCTNPEVTAKFMAHHTQSNIAITWPLCKGDFFEKE